jgi:hypothetical protein
MRRRLHLSLFTLALGAAVAAGCAGTAGHSPDRPTDAASVTGNWFYRSDVGRTVDSGDLLCLFRGGTFIRIDDSAGRPQHFFGGFVVGDRELVLMPERHPRERYELRQEGVFLILVDERGRQRRYERSMRTCDLSPHGQTAPRR